MAPHLPTTRLVCLADREADVMALMVRARGLGTPLDWLLRSGHNRTLSKGEKLWSRVTAGDKPIEWRLLTNLPVQTLEQAARMIDWYRARWEIEMFFHVLKNGCRIEALQLGCIDRIERALGL